MTSDLPGETGAPDPGLDRLFRTLTAAGTPAELTGEHEALAMFRATMRPPAGPALAPGRADAEPPAGSRRSGRLFRFPARWSVRLAAVAAAVAVSGAAAAAYAAVLPSPVQHLAHNVLGFAGVPDIRQPGQAHGTSPHHARSGHHGQSPVLAPPTTPATTPSGSAAGPTGSVSASPTAGAAAGRLRLSARVATAQITAGSPVVIDGRLTRRGAGVQGVTVTLIERLAGQRHWRAVASGQTTTDGNVVVSVPALTENAVFRLLIPHAAVSPSMVVTVSPPLTAGLDVGAPGAPDTLVVSTEYARAGDMLVLEVQAAGGGWRQVRFRRLTASGQASFSLSGNWPGNREFRVVLLATIRHGAAVSNTVTVPPG
jgi:hypothetical protein